MSARLEGSRQVNEIRFQDRINSFPHRDNYQKITDVIALHATDIESLSASTSTSEIIAARDQEADLQTAVRTGDEIGGDPGNGVSRFVLCNSLARHRADCP